MPPACWHTAPTRSPDAPDIAGASRIYLDRQLKAFRSGEREHERMSVIVEGLDDATTASPAIRHSSTKVTTRIPR